MRQNSMNLRPFLFGCLLIGFFFGVCVSPLLAAPEYWPTKGWRSSTPEAQGVESDKLITMLESVQKEGYKIDSISVVRNGYMVLDAYLDPFKKETLHVLHSVTKSFVSALVGIALDQGHIQSANQRMLDFFPEKTIANLDERKKKVTLEHLLMMASGLDTRDSYLYGWVGLSEMIASDDWAQHVLDRPMVQESGKGFEYSNGVSHLLSAILQKTTKMNALAFAQKNLFGPLGIQNVTWPTNPQGGNPGWAQMLLTPHDMAKFGLLYLNKGRWEGQQIVSKAWVEASAQSHLKATLFDGYGYQWWVDAQKYYMAVGYLGQFIFVVPEKNMVVVFTSNLQNYDFYVPQKLLDQFIIPAAVSSQAIAIQPENQERLEALVAKLAQFSSAPEIGIMWAADNNGKESMVGTYSNGKFTHIAPPAFEFEYPQTSSKQKNRFPDQILRMKTQRGNIFSVSIGEIPSETPLAEVGPNVFSKALKKFKAEILDVSNKPVTLKDGTATYRTDIDWTWQSTPLKTMLVSAFKSNKWVYLAYTINTSNKTSLTDDLQEGVSLIESLTFQ